MKLSRRIITMLSLTAFILVSPGIIRAEEDNPEPPKVLNPLLKETTIPCFIPGGAPAPENYLKKNAKGFGAIHNLFSIELIKRSDVGKFLTGGIFDLRLVSDFQEPALTAAEREKNKEKAPNKDNAWKLPPGAQAWDDIKPQYIFDLKAQSFDSNCADAAQWKFRVFYTKGGKDVSVSPFAILWKWGGANSTRVGGSQVNTAPAQPGLSVSFHFSPSSTLSKNEGVLYSGIPLSEKIEKMSVEATNCFGQAMVYTYHFRYGQVPQYVEERDPGSGMYQGRLKW